MTEVYFIRHAESDYSNHDDVCRPLTVKGMQDRLLVSKYLCAIGIDIVFSSPFKRAVDTVQDFADNNCFKIQCIDGFKERCIDSVWIEDFMDFSKKQWEDFSYKLSDGECLQEVQDRNISALKNILSKYKDKKIVIGSHGTALSTIINYYDSSFRFEDFNEIRKLMPWIVKFTFNNQVCLKIEKIDIFVR